MFAVLFLLSSLRFLLLFVG